MSTLRLAAAPWQATLLPALGGAIGGLTRAGVDVLRPTPAEPDSVLDTACFPLVPYANRIAHGRFRFAEQDVSLPRNFGDHPHTLHGVGWQRAWTVIEASSATATLRLEHDGDRDWPWAFVAEQRMTLDDAGLKIALTLTAGREAMPAGVGLHPYFPAPAGTRFQAVVSGAWLADETQLPTTRVPPDRFGYWHHGDSVTRPELVDHCHDGWSREARILYPNRTTTLRASGAGYLHLYMPPGETFFCAEPVSHLPDAVNHAGRGAVVLQPGERLGMTMSITA